MKTIPFTIAGQLKYLWIKLTEKVQTFYTLENATYSLKKFLMTCINRKIFNAHGFED